MSNYDPCSWKRTPIDSLTVTCVGEYKGPGLLYWVGLGRLWLLSSFTCWFTCSWWTGGGMEGRQLHLEIQDTRDLIIRQGTTALWDSACIRMSCGNTVHIDIRSRVYSVDISLNVRMRITCARIWATTRLRVQHALDRYGVGRLISSCEA